MKKSTESQVQLFFMTIKRGMFFCFSNKLLCCMQKQMLVAIDGLFVNVWEQGSIPVQMLICCDCLSDSNK